MFEKFIIRLLLITFFFTSIGPLPDVSAQSMIDLPAPGVMVNKSSPFEPLQLKGILVNTKNPLRFEFLVDKGDSDLYGQPLKDEIVRLAKYFLTCLTVPEDDLWVNLSPYEKDRIVPFNFGTTLMGKDLLEQDYLLKQIMASLSYPENDLGKRFWQRVYRKAYELYGTTEIPINTFNKVWILPKSADVYAQGNGAFVVKSQLDVMLEADYKAFVYHNKGVHTQGLSQNAGAYSQVFRDVIIPELRQEVNEGKNFAVVRQVYNAMILATWYKRHLKDSLLGRMYVGRNEVKGVDIADKNAKEKIFQQYLKAYKKCVYNYIKEDYDPVTQQSVPRKYASGGMYFAGFGGPYSVYAEKPDPKGMNIGTDLAMATVDVSATNGQGAIVQFPFWQAEVTNTHPFHQVPFEVNDISGATIEKNRISEAVQLAKLISQHEMTKPVKNTISRAVADAVGAAIASPTDAAQMAEGIINGLKDGTKKLNQMMVGVNSDLLRTGSLPFSNNPLVIDALEQMAENPEGFEKILTNDAPGKVQQIASILSILLKGNGKIGGMMPPDAKIVRAFFDETKMPKEFLRSSTARTLKNWIARMSVELGVMDIGDLLDKGNQERIIQVLSYLQFQIRTAENVGLRLDGTSLPAWQYGDRVHAQDLLNVIILVKKNRKAEITAQKPSQGGLTALPSPPTALAEDLPNKPPQINAVEDQSLPKGAGLFDTALPPPSASAGEEQVLAEDLAKVQAVASGKIAPPPPLPAEDDTKTSSGQNLWWMHAGAVLGGLGLSLFLDGGISWMVGAIPFITGGFYVAQKWFHENVLHLAPALALYPSKISTTLSTSNLKAHTSLSQWLKPLIPLTSAQRSYVDLPFAKAEGNWWNKLRNQLIAKAGLIGSIGLALTAGYFIGMTPLLAPLVFSALAIIKGSVESGDLFGSQDTQEGKFGCGIVGIMKRVPNTGILKNDLKPWINWFFKAEDASTPRGGQQAGTSTDYSDENGDSKQLLEKITKQKRNWMFWNSWDNGPVFYINMIKELQDRFLKMLPRKIVPVYNYSKSSVIKLLGHVRFATGGDMVEEAAHPQTSPREKRELWIYDSVKKVYRKVIRTFQVTSAFNGDKDASKLGIFYRDNLLGQDLPFRKMRTFFSAAVHSYYKNRVTTSYLRKTVSDGRKYKQTVQTNYRSVLRALRKKGYVGFEGYVNQRFVKLDEEFKSWFPDYKEEVFNEIECALFGIAPGDAPLLPRAQHLYLTQGSWFASLRYAHVMANHHDLQEAYDDILFEKEGRAVGSVFSEVYDQVEPFLERRGYKPDGPDKTRTLNDLYVKDKETAQKLGLMGQYQMLELFKQMLAKRMQQEESQQTTAGEVFRQWEQKWKRQGMDVEHMRRIIINVAVEKFFTADNLAATKEFAERSDGTFGLYMQNPLDNSITLYQNNQDVVIGLNQETGVIAFGSDPRSLKIVGPNGERINEVMPLKEGEVVNLSFAPSGKINVRSWTKDDHGKWSETPQDELRQRTYPTAEYVDGVKNPYYAPPPVEYKNPHRIVQEDLQNIPGILAQAQSELDDPNSFNMQSTGYLAQRINNAIRKKGAAKLRIIGYDNSRKISEQFKQIAGNLFEKSKLSVDVIDANQFTESPSKFDIEPDDIVMIVSKSGATFSSKLAMRIIKKLVHEQNIFCTTARIDSVLTNYIGQGLRPTDPFTKRIFVTGEFYPAETPVASEVLLMFQMQQLAVNLARALDSMNDYQNRLGLKFSSGKLNELSQRITEESIRMAQEQTGFDLKGQGYWHVDQEKKAIGRYLGNAALERWKVNRFKDFFVAGILSFPVLLSSHFIGWWGVIPDVIWINYVVPFLSTEIYRKMTGRPAYGRNAAFDLFIAGPPMISSTQRNFFSRILTNRFGSIGPGAIYGEDPTEDFVAKHAPDQKRGDITLKFSLDNRVNEGRMGINQATYPQTGIFGTNIMKGRPEIVDVIVKVPLSKDAAPNEVSLMDNTVGTLGLMIAAKTIGVEMAKVASFDGRLFNLAYTFSSAGVHTTQINPISQETKDILKGPSINGFSNTSLVGGSTADPAQMVRKGGIDMSSRLMRLNVSGDVQNRLEVNNSTLSGPAIQGVIPQVSGIVAVTPDMLKAMLGNNYLN